MYPYATAGIAADREEQTLVYLLVSPMPRPLIYCAKCSASLLLAVAWTMGGMTLMCWLGGEAGRAAWHVLWPGVMWSTIAYVALFLLFGVMFRRATIVALAYALFIETLIGNMPGIAQRLAISLHRCHDRHTIRILKGVVDQVGQNAVQVLGKNPDLVRSRFNYQGFTCGLRVKRADICFNFTQRGGLIDRESAPYRFKLMQFNDVVDQVVQTIGRRIYVLQKALSGRLINVRSVAQGL